MNDYDKLQKYDSIKKIVIEDLKNEAKEITTEPVKGWRGSALLNNTEYKRELEHRRRMRKGSKMLLEALKLLNY